MKKRILLFSYDYPPLRGGISRLFQQITTGLREMGHEVSILSEQVNTEKDDRKDACEKRFSRIQGVRELLSWVYLLKVFRFSRRFDCVVVGNWYPEGGIAVLAGARPLVCLVHGAELMEPRDWRRKFGWSFLTRCVLGASSLILSCSGYTKNLALSIEPQAKVQVLPLGVDTVRFSPGDKKLAQQRLGIFGKKVIGTVARIHCFKGFETVFDAIQGLSAEQRGQLCYLIAGTGPDRRYLESKVHELGLAENIFWLGEVEEQELPQVYRAMDLYVMPTQTIKEKRCVEGFGLSFLEAQASGVPVLGSKTGGISDAVKEGVSGWLIAPDDSKGLKELIQKLWTAETEINAMAISAREHVKTFSEVRNYIVKFSGELEKVLP